MNVNLRTVQRWARDGIDRDAMADAVQRFLEARRIATVAAPPRFDGDADGQTEARMIAIAPSVEAILAAAVSAGWRRSDAATAIVAVAISDVRDTAGDDMARMILDVAREAIEGEQDA
jgi:hypothetical protein